MIICNHCGTEDFYFEEKKGNFCAYCGKKIKKVQDVKLKFGKYKGRMVSTMKSKSEKQYLEWVLENFKDLNSNLEIAIINQIN